jgi:pimeloyl-ACP methyl ester carboxylesterase
MGQSTSSGIITEDELARELESHKSEDYSSYWTGTSRTRLAELEAKFFNSCTPLPFKQTVTGGLGTIEFDPDNQQANHKPILVLVHGYGLCNAMWALCVDQLHPHFKIFLVELHGHGRSDRLTFPDNLTADHAEQLMASYLELWRKVGLISSSSFLFCFFFSNSVQFC